MPVRVGKAVQKDAAIEVAAVGNVQAHATVSVKAQVSGQLIGVYFAEGQEVKKGDLLFQLDPRPYKAALEAAQANLARDRAQLENARLDVTRYEALLDGYVPRQQYDTARATAASLGASVKADEAAVHRARLDLEYTAIHSPLDGQTGSLLVNAGNVVLGNGPSQTALVVIDEIKPIYVAFSLPETFVPMLGGQPGRHARVVVTPRGGGPAREGEVTFVDNTVSTATGTILCKSTLPNTDRALWPGQFVDVLVTVGERPGALVVPAAAIQRGQAGSFVFVVKPDQTVDMRPVTVASAGAVETVVERGIAAGDTVVTDGQLRLRPGARVEVTPEQEARQ